MPATSGSITQASTSQPDAAALESVEADQFQSGDLAFLTTPPAGQEPFYYLDTTSAAVRDGSTVLYTRNSNPAYGGSGLGRWLVWNADANLFRYGNLSGSEVDIPIQSPGPSVLLTLAALVAPRDGSMDADMDFACSTGPNNARTDFWLEHSVNAGPFTSIGGSSGGPSIDLQVGGSVIESFNVVKGDSVVLRVSAAATQAGALISVHLPPGAPYPINHLAARLRFF